MLQRHKADPINPLIERVSEEVLSIGHHENSTRGMHIVKFKLSQEIYFRGAELYL